MGVQQLIAFRFLVAAAGLWLLAALTGQAPWAIERRRAAVLALMGLSLYSLQAYSFIFALTALPASFVSLVLYSYPALVAVGARVAFGRAITRAHAAGLLASFAGVALLVGGTGHVALAPALLFAALAPAVYTVYILAGDFVMRAAQPVAAACVVMSGAAVTFTVVGLASGQLRPPPTLQALLLLVAIGVVPTLLPITLFLASLPRIGAGRAALLSTWEPVVTVVLAAALLGDRLSPAQLAGGGLVIAAVAALQRPDGTAARPAPAGRDGDPPVSPGAPGR